MIRKSLFMMYVLLLSTVQANAMQVLAEYGLVNSEEE